MFAEEDADSLAFLTVSKAPTRYVAPAPTDVPMMYVPPPQFPAPFPFHDRSKPQYSALYGLVLVVNELGSLYTEGRVVEDDADPLFVQYRSQFDMINKSLKFSQDELQEFCDACNLDGIFAIQRLFDREQPADAGDDLGLGKTKFTAGVDIGSDLTSLSDMSAMNGTRVSQLIVIVLRLMGNYKRIGAWARSRVIQQKIEFWKNFCTGHRTSDVLTDDDRELLASDVAILRAVPVK